MSFIPDDAFKTREGIFLAPMIDFLFLMLMFFATLAISRQVYKDLDVELVELKEEKVEKFAENEEVNIFISINKEGNYIWETEIQNHPLNSVDEIAKELLSQHEKGIIPEEKEKTKVFLKIDKTAPWEPILKAFFTIQQAGFTAHPVYEPSL